MSEQTPPVETDPRGAFSAPLPPPGVQSSQGVSTGSSTPPPLPPQATGFGAYAPVPPQRPRKKHRVLRTLFLIVAFLVLGGSVLLNLVLLGSGSLSAESTGREVTLVKGSRTDRVAIVPVSGLIDEACASRFGRFMDRAEKDSTVKAVVIEIDTPGGSVTASDDIHHRIELFKQSRPGVPVVVSMGGMATSGGYYVACVADHIYAQHTTMTGNIGVLLPRYNLSKLAKTIGIDDATISSTGARFKNAGSMLKADDPVETQYFQALIDDAFTRFKTVITEGRGEKLTKPLDEIANGKVYMAGESLSLGLIDAVGYLDDAWRYAARKAQLQNPTVVRLESQPTLLQLLSSRAGSEGGQVSANGVTIHVGQDVLMGASRPGLMYLWQGQ